METYNDWLAHHGILGQKWGKRNGPPYPLGEEDHSVSEKKAGYKKSLDSDGESKKFNRRQLRRAEKEETKRKKQLEKEEKERERKLRNPEYVTQQLKDRISEDSNQAKIGILRNKGNEIINEYNDYANVIEDGMKRYKVSEEDKKWLKEQIKNDFGSLDMVDDDEFLELIAYEYADLLLRKNVVAKHNNKLQKIEENQKQYWSDIDALINDIAGDLSDKKATIKYHEYVKNGKDAVKDMMRYTFPASYAHKHLDEALFDTDAYYDAAARIFDEIQKLGK